MRRCLSPSKSSIHSVAVIASVSVRRGEGMGRQRRPISDALAVLFGDLPRSCSLMGSESVAVAASAALVLIALVRDASRLRMLCSLAAALVLAGELRGEVSSI